MQQSCDRVTQQATNRSTTHHPTENSLYNHLLTAIAQSSAATMNVNRPRATPSRGSLRHLNTMPIPRCRSLTKSTRGITSRTSRGSVYRPLPKEAKKKGTRRLVCFKNDEPVHVSHSLRSSVAVLAVASYPGHRRRERQPTEAP
jgi:hypothetical protein